MEYRILGPLEVRGEQGALRLERPKPRAVLAVLLLHANEPVSAERLALALWGEEAPAGAIKAIQVHVSRLRGALGDSEAITTTAAGYRLRVRAGELDLDRFERLADDGRRALEARRPEQATGVLREALALWRGPPLAEFAGEAFAPAAIARLEEQRLAALELRVEADLAAGWQAGLIGELQGLVAANRTRERLAGQLMLALYRSGRQADALEAYRRARGVLVAEIGAEPGPELRRLQAAILRQDASLEQSVPEAPQALAFEPAVRPDEIVRGLPARLKAARLGEFVGRERELAVLVSTLRAAAQGATQVVLMSGEPGIGKTRLAAEAAAFAEHANASVLYGRCDEELGAPHQPWREALGRYVRHVPLATLTHHAERHGGELSRLVPALNERLSDPFPPRRASPESERYLLYSAVADLLTQAAASGPVVLVLDDLHWADKPSLLLLRHVVGIAPAMALLIVATFRSTDVADGHPLRNLVADFDREPGITRLTLDGLTDGGVLSLIEARAGRSHDAQRALARTLRHETGGNPFFVKELLRHSAESAEPRTQWDEHTPDQRRGVMLPGTVREVVLRRVDRLGGGAREILASAAVIGCEFDVDLLRQVASAEDAFVAEVLDAGVRAALVAPAPGFGGRWGFVHSLIQATLYEALGAGNRRLLHRRVAGVLDARWGSTAGARSAELAHHWYAGGEPSDAATVANRARQAGDRALTEMAPDDAVRWYRRALECLDAGFHVSAGERCEMQIRLGEALRQAGDPTFRETLVTAARDAQANGDHDRLVRAALANSRGFVSAAGSVDDERITVLEAALAAEPTESATRARLLALLATELTFSGQWERRRSLSSEALGVARRAGDAATLSHVLTIRAASWTLQTMAELRANAREGLRLANHLTDPIAEFHALHWHAVVCVRAGDAETARSSVQREAKLATWLGQPSLRWQARYAEANLTLIAGHLTDAERLATDALELGTSTSQRDAQAFYLSQLFNIRYEQGRLGELRPLLSAAVEQHPGLSGFRALLALAACEDGADDDARRLLADAAADNFARVAYDLTWLTVLCAFAQVARHLNDAAAAQALYRLLAPFADQVACTGVGASMTVAHHLGVLATATGRYADAQEWLQRALRLHERMEAPVWVAHTRLALAEPALASSESSPLWSADTLLQQVHSAATNLGARAIERRAMARLTQLGVEPAAGG